MINSGQLVLDVEEAHELFVESIVELPPLVTGDDPWHTHPHKELEEKLTLIRN